MIITKLKGGLGNQMFQYATGKYLAYRLDQELKVDALGYDDPRVVNGDTPRRYGLENFNISSTEVSMEEVQKIKYPYGILSKGLRFLKLRVFKKNYLDYHPEIFNIKKKNIYLDGFFQSEENFKEIREMILKDFTPKHPLPKQDLIKEMRENNSVSVHIRRGDYVRDQKTNIYHGPCSKEYYINAISKIKENIDNPTFYFFSDDIEWVKDNFNIDSVNMKIGTDINLKDYEELILMSKCKHNIIANSSFSWWGAWLNDNDDKIVIAPTPWVNKIPNPHKNVVPKSWITIQK